ncbi:MAG TPA: TIGR03435 family protein [Bryobacteraceae bacterium]|jgi:uncharacterized protein (TIGR03435 family)
MKLLPLWPVLCVVAACPVGAQKEAESPAFDVASVKLHQASNPLGAMMQELPGRIQYRKITLLAVIRRAYNVQSQQIIGPPWLSMEPYDIEAKLPPDTPDARLQLMLQNLLAQRFHLKIHHGKKELPAYDLVRAKDGIKMHRSNTGRLGYAPTQDNSGHHFRGRITLPIFANNLSGIVDRPVSDQTGLDGLYDIDLNFTDDVSTDGPVSYPGLFTALQEQLGLKLESKKALFETIVVDEVDKIPEEN